MSFVKSLKKAVKSVAGGPSGLLDAVSGGANTAGAAAIASNVLPSVLTGGQSSGLPGILSNLVNGAVGVGSDYLQSQVNLAFQKDLAKYTAEQQNALNEQAFQRNLQQWNMENAYNSPAEQMKRFEEAGLNKNLIYGQQNTAANSPTLQPATYDPGQYHPVDKSSQRQALQLALMEHKQRIVNQAIENDLARQRIELSARAADRDDLLAVAQIKALGANLGLTNARINDIVFKEGLPQSWIGKQYNDIKGVASDIGNGISNVASSLKSAVASEFKKRYPKLSNFKWK